MNNVPKIISTKDLDYIKDMLIWNLIASKKANNFLDEIEDKEVADITKEMANLHAEHYNFILNILK